MNDTQLVTLAELRETYDVSKNFRDVRLDAHIMRAQRNDVRPILGEALYYNLMQNLTDPKYILLINGGSYDYRGETIFFQGLTPLISAYAYARTVSDNDVFVTAKGNKTKTDPNSTQTSESVVNEKSRQAVSEAVNIGNEVIRFLEQNPTDYPLFKPKAEIRTSFKFIKVTKNGPRHYGNRRDPYDANFNY